MNEQFANYILNRAVGRTKIGLTRQDIVSQLGLPLDWKGKPPTIGQAFTKPDESDVWFYYDGGCGVRFGVSDKIVELIVYPAKVVNTKYPFVEWPFSNGLTTGAFRNYLIENGIPFEEKWLGKGDLHYIKAADHCFTYSAYYKDGVALSPDEQDIILIGNLADDESSEHFTLETWLKKRVNEM